MWAIFKMTAMFLIFGHEIRRFTFTPVPRFKYKSNMDWVQMLDQREQGLEVHGEERKIGAGNKTPAATDSRHQGEHTESGW